MNGRMNSRARRFRFVVAGWGKLKSTMENDLKQIRSALALTQQEMADEIGVKIETVKALERDGRLPSNKAVRDNLVRLARRADIEIKALAPRGRTAGLAAPSPAGPEGDVSAPARKKAARASSEQLSKILAQMVDDYEKCAADMDGHIKPWRRQLIAKARALLNP